MNHTYILLYKQGGRCYRRLQTGPVTYVNPQLSGDDDITDEDFPEKNVFMAHDEMRAMTIARSYWGAVCAAAGEPIEAVLEDVAQIIGVKIENVEFKEESISKALTKASAVTVLETDVNGHFPITWGRNPEEAYTALMVFKKAAETYVKADLIGERQVVPYEVASKMRNTYLNSYSHPELKNPEFEEKMKREKQEKLKLTQSLSFAKLRSQLVEYGNMLVKENLVQGTWGNLSVRLDNETMLVTPSGIPYDLLTPADMVPVNIDTLEYDGHIKPTSEMGMHGAIYDLLPDTGAVIHTHSRFASIYAAAGKDIQVPSSMIEDLGTVIYATEYEPAGSDELTDAVRQAMTKNGRGCIMTNHGMVAAGRDLQEAFEICCNIEAAAKVYVDQKEREYKEMVHRRKEEIAELLRRGEIKEWVHPEKSK